MLADPPLIVYQDRSCMVATWRSVILPVMGKDKLPVESAKRQVAALEAFGKRLGKGKMGEITLVASEAPLPEADTRAVLDGGVPIVSPYYAVVGAVFEGVGFRGALVRGIFTSFQLLSRTKYPQKTFSTVEECASWIVPYLRPLGMAATVDDVIEAVRQVQAVGLAAGIL